MNDEECSFVVKKILTNFKFTLFFNNSRSELDKYHPDKVTLSLILSDGQWYKWNVFIYSFFGEC